MSTKSEAQKKNKEKILHFHFIQNLPINQFQNSKNDGKKLKVFGTISYCLQEWEIAQLF